MILALITAFVFNSAPVDQYGAELTDYIEDFLEPVNKTRNYHGRYAKALEMIPSILDYCEQYNVDPLMVATMIELEGSWRPDVVGALGEVGPLQVMPRWFKKVFGLDDLDSQLHAGIYHIRRSLDRCDQDIGRAFSYYASNRCGAVPSSKSRFRERKYLRAVKKYRKERIR